MVCVCVCGGGLNWQEERKLKIEMAQRGGWEGRRPKSMIRRVCGGTRGPRVTVGEDRFIYYRRQGREGAAEQIAAPGERKRCAKDDRKRENDRQTQGTRGDRKSPKKGQSRKR